MPVGFQKALCSSALADVAFHIEKAVAFGIGFQFEVVAKTDRLGFGMNGDSSYIFPQIAFVFDKEIAQRYAVCVKAIAVGHEDERCDQKSCRYHSHDDTKRNFFHC